MAHAWLGAHRGQGWGRGRGGDGFTSSRDLRCLPQSVSRDEGGWVASPKGQWVWVMGAVSLGPPTPSVLEADVHRATPSSPLHTTDTAVTGLTESRVFNQKGETAEEGLCISGTWVHVGGWAQRDITVRRRRPAAEVGFAQKGKASKDFRKLGGHGQLPRFKWRA